MPSRMQYEVDDRSAVTVVRLAGPLDLTTSQEVFATLRDCLAAQPDALVVDLSDTRVEERLALSVFAAVARQAAAWPDVPVVLCGPGDREAEWLAEAASCHVVPVRPDCAAAVREATGPATPRLRIRLEPVAGACRRGRELVADACRRWDLPELVGPASLVLTELVANVIRHARTPMDVTLTLRAPYLQVAVADGNRDSARPRDPDDQAEGGRGLLLVRETAQRWGSLPAGRGKVVWAMLPAT